MIEDTNIKQYQTNINSYISISNFEKALIEYIKLLDYKTKRELNLVNTIVSDQVSSILNKDILEDIHSRVQKVNAILLDNSLLNEEIDKKRKSDIWYKLNIVDSLLKHMDEENLSLNALIIKRIKRTSKLLSNMVQQEYFELLNKKNDNNGELDGIFDDYPFSLHKKTFNSYKSSSNYLIETPIITKEDIFKEYVLTSKNPYIVDYYEELKPEDKKSLNFNKNRYLTIYENLNEITYITNKINDINNSLDDNKYKDIKEEFNAILKELRKQEKELLKRLEEFSSIEDKIEELYNKKNSKESDEDMNLEYLSYVPLEEQQLIAESLRKEYIEELAKNGNKSDIKKIREIENKIKEQIISLGKERYLDNNKISKK